MKRGEGREVRAAGGVRNGARCGAGGACVGLDAPGWFPTAGQRWRRVASGCGQRRTEAVIMSMSVRTCEYQGVSVLIEPASEFCRLSVRPSTAAAATHARRWADGDRTLRCCGQRAARHRADRMASPFDRMPHAFCHHTPPSTHSPRHGHDAMSGVGFRKGRRWRRRLPVASRAAGRPGPASALAPYRVGGDCVCVCVCT